MTEGLLAVLGGVGVFLFGMKLMTEALRGRSRGDAEAVFEQVHAMLTGRAEADPATIGKLAALAGVRDYPTRVKCASLCWHTMHSALGEGGTVSTE